MMHLPRIRVSQFVRNCLRGLLRSVIVNDRVARDLVQPWSQLRGLLEPLSVGVRLDEDVLHDVLRARVVAHALADEADQIVTMALPGCGLCVVESCFHLINSDHTC